MIREGNGIKVSDDFLDVTLDGSMSSDHSFVSHAHFDHFNASNSGVVCSDVTAKLMGARTGKDIVNKVHDSFEMINSGHVLGSRAVLFETDRYGRVLYTGDFALSSRAFLDGFDPVSADTLIMESTYGIDNYVFPGEDRFEEAFSSWLELNKDKPLFLFGYSLGKAQKILYYLNKYFDGSVRVYHTIEKLMGVYDEFVDFEFDYEGFELSDIDKESAKDSVYLLPSSVSKNDNVQSTVDRVGGLKVGFSGWAKSDSYKYRGGYDETFVLSDHADFEGLVETVERVDPQRVLTFHGFDEEFASYLRKNKRVNAKALKKNQTSLNNF